MNPKINGLDVVASWKADNEYDGTVFIARRTFSESSPHCEFVVSRTWDGETWEHGEYFHSADYGSEQKAKLAAMLRFLYRAGFTSYFGRLNDILEPWAKKGMDDLGLSHSPDRAEPRYSLHESIKAALADLRVGEYWTVREIHHKRQQKNDRPFELGGTGATVSALRHIIEQSKGEFEWTTNDKEAKAVIRLR
jgi:hypothetical protein